MKKVLIAIPSYGRAQTTKIFNLLMQNYAEFEDVADVRGFVVKLQRGMYSRCFPKVEFIVRPSDAETDIGLCRKFIVDWALEQGYEFILMLDDDTDWVRISLRGSDVGDLSHIKSLKDSLGVEDTKDIKEKLFWDPDKAKFCYYSNPNKAKRSLTDRETLLKLIEIGQNHCMIGPVAQSKVYGKFEPFLSRGQATQVLFLNIKRMQDKNVNFAAFSKHGVEDLYLGYQLLLTEETPKYTNIAMSSAATMGQGKGGWNVINPDLESRLQSQIDLFVANATEHPEYYEVSTAQSGLPSIKFSWKNIPKEFD